MTLSEMFFEFCSANIGKSVRYLTDKYDSNVYIPKWKLYVPQYILSLIK